MGIRGAEKVDIVPRQLSIGLAQAFRLSRMPSGRMKGIMAVLAAGCGRGGTESSSGEEEKRCG